MELRCWPWVWGYLLYEYRISLTEDALDDDTDLRKNVKRILEVIVGLLKDRVSVSDEPSSKNQEKIEIYGAV